MTICVECGNHYVNYWGYTSCDDLCRAKPLPTKKDLVTGEVLNINFHSYCRDINKGNCPYFIKKEIEIVEPKKGLLSRIIKYMEEIIYAKL